MHHGTTTTPTRGTRGPLPARSAAAPSGGAAAAAQLRAVLDAMPEAVLVADPDDRIRLVNPAADRLFRDRPVHDRDDLFSRFVEEPADPARADAVRLRSRSQPTHWFELRTRPLGQGQESPARSQASAGRLYMLRDVTAEREERAQRHAFLSILSHELRTPITTIYAGSRVLAKKENDAEPTAREIAADISAEAARLYNVVEDLLVLSRAEQDLLDFADDAVLLQRVVESAIRISRTRDGQVPIVIQASAEPSAVRGDAMYIEQIVRNLVTSAARFGGPDAPVVVRLEESGEEVSVSVLDRGPSPTDEDLRTSFSLSEKPNGRRSWGIGLAMFVCRRLVEAMKGRVWARRRQGGGAEFGFALPRYPIAD